jgi:hypothetical protein
MSATALEMPDRPEDGGRPQHEVARDLANQTRLQHAAVKRHVRMGADRDAQLRRVAALLIEPSGPASTMRVVDLLLAPTRVGPALVDRLLERTRINGLKRVGQLQHRQAEELGRLLCDPKRAEQATLWETLGAGEALDG